MDCHMVAQCFETDNHEVAENKDRTKPLLAVAKLLARATSKPRSKVLSLLPVKGQKEIPNLDK
ncbi:hypothetical protein O9G_001351 [Rozella allomycis CSF55]|uniref:Uncharacterized protein n=1 Tax=Rozella allomycis (strain CSF55) TaxID=988480 RepID=A0A075AV64_ROZAC|nr:hypothetical protein O9G_001351 [Rozella allomycis CSF55]|eukprot:EPZ32449.1 hypothetical protein O9G_001351 [Rozella allomycis CSF55]